MNTTILAIDQGTTNTKARLVSMEGTILARGSQPTAVTYPRPGWVEQDARAIWACTQAAIRQCLAGIRQPRLTAIAITNQRETALIWDRATGEPLGPCVVWQCRRSAAFCEALKAAGLEPELYARTGLQVDPMFSASKLRWLLDTIPDGLQRAQAGELCGGNIDSWLLWQLTGGTVHATDLTNASRTQLLNLRALAWDEDALRLFGIPAAMLPTLGPSSGVFGETCPSELLPSGLPIASMIGDSHAALYGQGGFAPGSVKATYGTGTSLMTPTTGLVASRKGLSTTIAWAHPRPVYALEGNIYTTGGTVQWLGGLMDLVDPGTEIERLARSVEDSGGVTFVPALVGLGAPHWAPAARAILTGLSLGTAPAHLARAALEAIACQVWDVFEVMRQESGVALHALFADGGASRNDLLMQLQADILDCPVHRSQSTDASALGAAFLAGLAVGLWRSEADITALVPPRDRFEPRMSVDRRAALQLRWQDALARALGKPR